MKKYLSYVLLVLVLVLVQASSAFAGASKKTLWVTNAQTGAKHRMDLYDRNGDGNYDFIKNYFYNEKGDCIYYAEGPIAKIKTPTNAIPPVTAADVCNNINNKELFLVANYSDDTIDSTLLKKGFDVVLFDNIELNGPGYCNIKLDEVGNYSISVFEVDSLTDAKITKSIVLKLNPNDLEEYQPEDLKYSINQIISNNIINISLGKFTAKAIVKFELFDMNGVNVLTVFANNSLEQGINVSNLNNGTYILRSTAISGFQYSQNVLINR